MPLPCLHYYRVNILFHFLIFCIKATLANNELIYYLVRMLFFLSKVLTEQKLIDFVRKRIMTACFIAELLHFVSVSAKVVLETKINEHSTGSLLYSYKSNADANHSAGF